MTDRPSLVVRLRAQNVAICDEAADALDKAHKDRISAIQNANGERKRAQKLAEALRERRG